MTFYVLKLNDILLQVLTHKHGIALSIPQRTCTKLEKRNQIELFTNHFYVCLKLKGGKVI